MLKLSCIIWMLFWFVVIFKSMVKSVNSGLDPFAGIMAMFTVWFLIGLFPVLIIKFGMGFLK